MQNKNSNLAVQITKIINQKYNKRQQSLNLQQKSIWIDILQYQDWSCLKQLNLRNCKINDTNIKIVTNLKWPNLTKLLLWRNNLTYEGVKKLMDNGWDKLELLQLDQNKIGNQGFDYLIKKQENFIKKLQVAKNNLNGLCLSKKFMDNTASTTNLMLFNLSDNKIGLTGIKLLTKVKLDQLEDLTLDNCYIGNQGCKYLTKSKWPLLSYLHIQNNKIGIDGHWNLLLRSNWKKNNYLSIGDYHRQTDQNYVIQAIDSIHFLVYEMRGKKIHRNIVSRSLKQSFKQMYQKFI